MSKGKSTSWVWYNGCSWWRLGTKEGSGTKETLILCPTIDSDGHPNLNCSQEHRDLIALAPKLLNACKKAESIAEQLEEVMFASGSKPTKTFYSDFKYIKKVIVKATNG